MSFIGGSQGLKRDCTSLSSENICSACGKSFSAPHILDKHQKYHCKRTSYELRQLTAYAKSHAAGGHRVLSSPVAKRRRLDDESTNPIDTAMKRPINSEGPLDAYIDVVDDGKILEQQPRQASSLHLPAPSNATGNPVGVSTPDSGTTTAPPLTQASTSEALQQSNHDNLSRPGSGPSKAQQFTTSADIFGLKKRYHSTGPPRHDPDSGLTAHDLYDSTHHADETEPSPSTGTTNKPDSDPSPTDTVNKPDEPAPTCMENDQPSQGETTTKPSPPSYHPFPNLSSFELGEWFYGQGGKSLRDFKALIDILTHRDFSIDEIKKIQWKRIFQELGKNKEELNPHRSAWVDDAGWKTTPVEIEVPVHRYMEGAGVEKHVMGKLFHRSIVAIIEEKIRNSDDSRFFHHEGFELLWKPNPADDASPEFRVLSELYHSDAFLQAQREVRESPPPQIKDCEHQRVVVGLMLWSDATQISTFSPKKLWPLYMLFGNESKHKRGKGSADLCHHVAYFDTISDDFKDYITGRTGGRIPPDLQAHLSRECFHAQWRIILDEELLKAIVEGLVIKCSDGVTRRFFIRIFTYSADYPERVLIATIRGQSDCPCVRCLVTHDKLDQCGTPEDIAFRKKHPRIDNTTRREGVRLAKEQITKGFAVKGNPVLAHLKYSGAPTVNAFSEKLGSTAFDIFACLAVDVLHEFESGTFKASFHHIIRVLEASSAGDLLRHEMDRRYRQVPTFNQTIRRFSANASHLARRAARDYEDLLQCAIPVFDGLVPGPLDPLLLKLLFCFARWQALAKLRMQTDATIELLEQATEELGDELRSFVVATEHVPTVETKREAEKRERDAKRKEAEKEEKEAKKKEKEASRREKEAEKEAKRKDKEAEREAKGWKKRAPPKSKAPPKAKAPAQAKAKAPAKAKAKAPAKAKGPARNDDHVSPAPTSQTLTDLSGGTHGSLIASSSGSSMTLDGGPVVSNSGVQDVEPALLGETLVDEDTGVCDDGAKKPKRKPVKMNIGTIKFHMLGHYVPDIRRIGPTDLYSTEWGESFHQAPKAWAKHTSWKQIRKEISQHERRRVRLRRTKNRLLANGWSSKMRELMEQRQAARNPEIHHFIGTSKQDPVWLAELSQDGRFASDLASADFVRNLKQYLLPRYIALTRPSATPQELAALTQAQDWSNLVFKDDRLYTHKTMRVKFTTYDARRDEDIIHLETDQCNLMVLNPEYSYPTSSGHPFRYGKVLGILHADVGYVGSIGRSGGRYTYTRMEFLWVRWYEVRPASTHYDLDRAVLPPIDDPRRHSLAFIDPLEVLRACHIVPCFKSERRFQDGVGKSNLAQDGLDWNEYCINRFVDRDMFMRYEWGLAVGHTYAHKDAVAANMEVIARSRRRHPGGFSQAEDDQDQNKEGEDTRNEQEEQGRNQPDAGEEGEGEAVGEGAGMAEAEGEVEDQSEDEEEEQEIDGEAEEEEDYNGDDDEDRDFGKGYESEDERAYIAFGECRDRSW